MKPSLSDILKAHQGIIFGDDHDNPDITGYLTSQMGNLAKAGVKVLFMEMFLDTHQHEQWLNDFNQGGNASASIRDWLDTKWKHYTEHGVARLPEDYLAMLEEARTHGIKIVGIEPEERHPFLGVQKSNEVWAANIQAYLARHPGEKYAVFAGRLHTDMANQYSLESECDRATGIDKMLGIPCVFFATVSAMQGEPKLQPAEYPGNYCIVLPKHRGINAVMSIH